MTKKQAEAATLSVQLYDLIEESNDNDLDKLIEHIAYADEHIKFAQKLFKNGALTEQERKSNEGVHFGSNLYYLIRHCPDCEQALNLIKIFRDPEGNKHFIENLNAAAKAEGAEQFSGSLIPPEEN